MWGGGEDVELDNLHPLSSFIDLSISQDIYIENYTVHCNQFIAYIYYIYVSYT